MLKKSAYMIILFLILGACSRPEGELLEDLTEKIASVRGNLNLAREALKKFLAENQEKMTRCVEEYQGLDTEKKQERFLDFNRRFYDRTGLFEAVDRYGFLSDPEFDALFEQFKLKMKPFFSEENGG